MTPEDFILISGIIGSFIAPVYTLLLYQSKRLVNAEKCIIKVKTALRMKFDDLKDILD